MLTAKFKRDNLVTLCIQNDMLGGWIDLYIKGRLVLTKKFNSDAEFASLKEKIINVTMALKFS